MKNKIEKLEAFFVENWKVLIVFFIAVAVERVLVGITKSFLFEFLGYILIGGAIALLKGKTARRCFLGLFTVGVGIAIVFDPILKPFLDKVTGANTVPTLELSLLINLFVLAGLFLGYFVLKLAVELKK